MRETTDREVELLRELESIVRYDQAVCAAMYSRARHEALRGIAKPPRANRERDVLADLDRERSNYEIPAGATPLEVWRAMPLDEKRPYHEKFARGYEAFLFKGEAPPLDPALAGPACELCGALSSEHPVETRSAMGEPDVEIRVCPNRSEITIASPYHDPGYLFTEVWSATRRRKERGA